MSKKTKKTSNSRKSQNNSEALPDIESMQFWRTVVKAMLPDEEDDWLLGEAATALRLQTQLWGENWNEINRIAAKTDNKVNVSWSLKVDRSTTPPLVTVKGSYSEKHSMSAESDVADPNQDSLPGLNEEDQERVRKELNVDYKGRPKDEDEDPPRVTAGVPEEIE